MPFRIVKQHDTSREQLSRHSMRISQGRGRIVAITYDEQRVGRVFPLLLFKRQARLPGWLDADALAHEPISRPRRADPATLRRKFRTMLLELLACERRGTAAGVHAADRCEGASPGCVGKTSVGIACAGSCVATFVYAWQDGGSQGGLLSLGEADDARVRDISHFDYSKQFPELLAESEWEVDCTEQTHVDITTSNHLGTQASRQRNS